MGRNYSRVKRGMVFWLNMTKTYNLGLTFISPNNGKEYKTSIQRFNRPYLVVSNDQGNESAPTCNVVPITTEDKTDLPVHVKFTYQGVQQTILVEQPTTVDIMALGEYMCTLSDDIMREVERAQIIQNNIRPTVTYMDLKLENLLKHLEETVSNLIKEKLKAIQVEKEEVKTFAIEDTALQLGQMLEDLCKPASNSAETTTPLQKSKQSTPQSTPSMSQQPKHNPQSSQKKYAGMSAVEKFNARYNQAPSQTQPTQKAGNAGEPTKKPSKRNSWTLEKRREYLEDCEKLSPQEVMKKWNLSTVQSVFQTKYHHKNVLAKLVK